MNDRELLERAARAAGIEGELKSGGEGELWLFHFGAHSPWNPLINDGDALRLATTLCMTVNTGPCEASASTIAGALRGFFAKESTIEQPQSAAVRRAIVRAAAEMCP